MMIKTSFSLGRSWVEIKIKIRNVKIGQTLVKQEMCRLVEDD